MEKGMLRPPYIQVFNDCMFRINLKHPSASHILQARGITNSLWLHQPARILIRLRTLCIIFSKCNLRSAAIGGPLPFHVGRPTKLPRYKNTRRWAQTIWDLNTSNSITQTFLDPITSLAKFLLHLLFFFHIFFTWRNFNLSNYSLHTTYKWRNQDQQMKEIKTNKWHHFRQRNSNYQIKF